MATQIHYWCPDVDKALAYCVGALSLELLYRKPEEGPTDFCMLKLGDAQIMIGANPEAMISADRAYGRLMEKIVPRVSMLGPISVCIGKSDLGAFYDQISARAAQIVEPIWSTPWGTRQFSVLDPANNIATFFAE